MELYPEENHDIGLKLMEQGGVDDRKEIMRLHIGGDFSLLRSGTSGFNDKPLSCYGCGIGWFSFVMGFVFPPLWYYATILYLQRYYLKEPRERAGLAASAIAALICSVAVLISILAVFA